MRKDWQSCNSSTHRGIGTICITSSSTWHVEFAKDSWDLRTKTDEMLARGTIHIEAKKTTVHGEITTWPKNYTSLDPKQHKWYPKNKTRNWGCFLCHARRFEPNKASWKLLLLLLLLLLWRRLQRERLHLKNCFGTPYTTETPQVVWRGGIHHTTAIRNLQYIKFHFRGLWVQGSKCSSWWRYL